MKKSEKILAAVLTMVIGVTLIVLKGSFIGLLMTVAGVSLIVLGCMDIFNRNVPLAVVKIVVGIFVIVCGWTVVEAVLYVAAALLLIAGILLLYEKIRWHVRRETWLLTACEYVVPSVYILTGALLLFHHGAAMNAVLLISGVLLLLQGGVMLFKALTED